MRESTEGRATYSMVSKEMKTPLENLAGGFYNALEEKHKST